MNIENKGPKKVISEMIKYAYENNRDVYLELLKLKNMPADTIISGEIEENKNEEGDG